MVTLSPKATPDVLHRLSEPLLCPGWQLHVLMCDSNTIWLRKTSSVGSCRLLAVWYVTVLSMPELQGSEGTPDTAEHAAKAHVQHGASTSPSTALELKQ